MTFETKSCKNCSKTFEITSDDFAFYEKMQVPAPTWCPECRMMRRMVFRNERTLYKRTCAMCQKDVITQYAPEKPFIVYCTDCYASDRWDALSYGRGYDFSKPFFEQYHNLMLAVPRRALYQDFVEHSEYTNHATNLKNAYLVFGGHHYEDCSYCAQNFYLTDCVDVDFSTRCESCYDSVNLRNCNKVMHSSYSEDCADSSFLMHCRNCTNCFGCVNLRNASYHIFNQSYSKEAYYEKIREFKPEEFYEFSLKFPRKFAFNRNAINSAGEDLENVKNCRHCFFVVESEDVAYSFFVPTGAKNCYDVEHFGMNSEKSYEVISGFRNSHVCFCNRTYYSHDVFYGDDCYNSSNLFGCIGMRKKEYCILNKQYTREEYYGHRMSIVEKMKKDREYGEFFPIPISPFAYNESMAQVYFPINRNQAATMNYPWRVREKRDYKIGGDIIGCMHRGECLHDCTTAFRLIDSEKQFYERFHLPIPAMCPNCRYHERLKLRNPLKLWHRSCMNQGCENEFETSYAPDRKEIVYCESCYQREVL